MTPQPDSPNWHWQQLGYEVERTGQRRTIRRPDASTVDIAPREGGGVPARRRGTRRPGRAPNIVTHLLSAAMGEQMALF